MIGLQQYSCQRIEADHARNIVGRTVLSIILLSTECVVEAKHATNGISIEPNLQPNYCLRTDAKHAQNMIGRTKLLSME